MSLTINWVEWFGYFASLVILISLTMPSIIKLRVINFIGSLLFAAFAYIIESWPTLVMNLGIAVIHVYFLYGLFATKEQFKIVSTCIDSEYLRFFIKNNQKEISKQVSVDKLYHANRVYYMLRDDNIAGVLMGRLDDNGCFDLYLDFVLPRYRDFKLGTYYFITHQYYLKQKGINLLQSAVTNKAHQQYLMKMGFVVDPLQQSILQKRI